MKIFCGTNVKTTKLTIICCLHGDEVFGIKVFNFFRKNIKKYPRLKLILANEPAIRAKRRFLDEDINRAFPGAKNGSRERRLARKTMKAIGRTEHLLDIHTTTSKIKMAPIAASLSKNVQNIINLSSSREVVSMSRAIAQNSLIGQLPSLGVSLEFNERYARKSAALKEVEHIVRGLLDSRKMKPKKRTVYFVSGVIKKSTSLPKTAANFKFIPAIGGYPFLLYEKSYKDIHAFLSRRRKVYTI